MSMPPPGHPAHPEMQGLYGPGGMGWGSVPQANVGPPSTWDAASRRAEKERLDRRRDELQGQKEAAARRGEPLEIPKAARRFVSAAVAALSSAGWPDVTELRFKTGRFRSVTIRGVLLWTERFDLDPDTQQSQRASEDWLLTTDGDLARVTNSTGGYGTPASRSYERVAISGRYEVQVAKCLIEPLQKRRLGVEVPWALMPASLDLAKVEAELRDWFRD